MPWLIAGPAPRYDGSVMMVFKRWRRTGQMRRRIRNRFGKMFCPERKIRRRERGWKETPMRLFLISTPSDTNHLCYQPDSITCKSIIKSANIRKLQVYYHIFHSSTVFRILFSPQSLVLLRTLSRGGICRCNNSDSVINFLFERKRGRDKPEIHCNIRGKMEFKILDDNTFEIMGIQIRNINN